jgi:hypothetical protein
VDATGVQPRPVPRGRDRVDVDRAREQSCGPAAISLVFLVLLDELLVEPRGPAARSFRIVGASRR